MQGANDRFCRHHHTVVIVVVCNGTCNGWYESVENAEWIQLFGSGMICGDRSRITQRNGVIYSAFPSDERLLLLGQMVKFQSSERFLWNIADQWVRTMHDLNTFLSLIFSSCSFSNDWVFEILVRLITLHYSLCVQHLWTEWQSIILLLKICLASCSYYLKLSDGHIKSKCLD